MVTLTEGLQISKTSALRIIDLFIITYQENPIAAIELIRKANNPQYTMFSNTLNICQENRLIDSSGDILNGVRQVLLSAFYIEERDIKVRNPFLEKPIIVFKEETNYKNTINATLATTVLSYLTNHKYTALFILALTSYGIYDYYHDQHLIKSANKIKDCIFSLWQLEKKPLSNDVRDVRDNKETHPIENDNQPTQVLRSQSI